jgi:UDP-N-acetylglucosamine--N-acetylmuramyl-(pentapeptide) pyrophosphoryl-undecaprenol N-acetylglucosamine transferase
MNNKKILFAVGGTGGHLYPATALAKKLLEKDASLSILFAGGGVKNPNFFRELPFEYEYVSCAPLSPNRPLKSFFNLFTIIKGIWESKTLLQKYNPSLVVGFGSFYSLPLLIAAKRMKIPYILHEQNTVPGRVIRLFSKSAKFTAIHFEKAQSFLKGKGLLVEMPLRWHLSKDVSAKENAKRYFSLNEKVPVVLIFGGSQGAAAINSTVLEGIKEKGILPFQIIHFSGSALETEKLKRAYKTASIPYCVKDFEVRMDLAWQAADCVISRSGAMSMAEQIEFEVPGILIPYPLAMDNHQEVNADFFMNEIGGGIKYLEKPNSGDDLIAVLSKMLKKDEINRLRQNIAWYKRQKKSQDMAVEILKLLED